MFYWPSKPLDKGLLTLRPSLKKKPLLLWPYLRKRPLKMSVYVVVTAVIAVLVDIYLDVLAKVLHSSHNLTKPQFPNLEFSLLCPQIQKNECIIMSL